METWCASLAIWCLRPLGHLSARRKYSGGPKLCGYIEMRLTSIPWQGVSPNVSPKLGTVHPKLAGLLRIVQYPNWSSTKRTLATPPSASPRTSDDGVAARYPY